MIENVGTGLAKSEGGEAIAPTTSQQATTTTRGRKPGRKVGSKEGMAKLLESPAKEMLSFGQGLEQLAESAEDSQVEYLAERLSAMPGNVRDKLVTRMAEVEADPESFRQDAEFIFESLFDVSQFALG